MDDYELMEEYFEFADENFSESYENDFETTLAEEEWEAYVDDLEMFEYGKVESIGTISKANYIKWMQRSLNRILGLKLPVDGKTSIAYRDAVRSFNKKYVKTKKPDDRVDELTQNAIIKLNEKSWAYMVWVQDALRKTGAGLVSTGKKDKSTRTYLKLFQTYNKIKDDAFVGAKTETALIKASGTNPPGHIKPKVKPVKPVRPVKPKNPKVTDVQLDYQLRRLDDWLKDDAIGPNPTVICLVRKLLNSSTDDTYYPVGEVRSYLDAPLKTARSVGLIGTSMRKELKKSMSQRWGWGDKVTPKFIEQQIQWRLEELIDGIRALGYKSIYERRTVAPRRLIDRMSKSKRSLYSCHAIRKAVEKNLH